MADTKISELAAPVASIDYTETVPAYKAGEADTVAIALSAIRTGLLLSSTAASIYQTQAAMSAYQLALVSGTTIKTVGGVSLLGSGDVSVGVGDMLLGTAQEITGAKTFDASTLVLKGSSSGTSTLNAAAVAGTTTFTLPGSSGTLALLSDIPSLTGYLTSTSAASTYLALSGGTLTGGLVANAGLTLGGNINAAAWGLTGVKLKGGTSTLTDTSSSGTVTSAATNSLGGNTIAASNATTITDYFSLYLALPVAGSNVTLTNRWSLGLEGALKATAATLTGGALTLNGATSGASVLSAPAVAGSATITLPGVTSTLATLGANTFTALQTITQASANAGIIASTGYSLTGSDATPMINLAGTWNTSGTPSAIKLNITDTASDAASLLIDLQVGGTSKMSVDKAGRLGSNFKLFQADTSTWAVSSSGLGWASKVALKNNGVQTHSGGYYSWANSSDANGTTDTFLFRDGAAGIIAQRNGVNAQALRVYGTYTDASNYERLALKTTAGSKVELAAETAGTGGDNLDVALTPAGTGGVTLGANYQQLTEMTAPAAGASNTVRIYAEDNGAGKTRLMAIFPTGAAQQIAIEP